MFGCMNEFYFHWKKESRCYADVTWSESQFRPGGRNRASLAWGPKWVWEAVSEGELQLLSWNSECETKVRLSIMQMGLLSSVLFCCTAIHEGQILVMYLLFSISNSLIGYSKMGRRRKSNQIHLDGGDMYILKIQASCFQFLYWNKGPNKCLGLWISILHISNLLSSQAC